MDKKTNRAIKQFIKKVSEQNTKLVSVYLFGSYAKNNQRPESDIDIALFIENLNDSDKFDIQVQMMLLASQFDSRIEPHPFSYQEWMSEQPIINEIKKTGIEIKLKENTNLKPLSK